MKNKEAVDQWIATLNADKAYQEIHKLKEKYPWLKCDETLKFIDQMYTDLPKIGHIIQHQEEQNILHREFVRLSQIADPAIVNAIEATYNKSHA